LLENCDALWIRVQKFLHYMCMSGYIQSTNGAEAYNIIERAILLRLHGDRRISPKCREINETFSYKLRTDEHTMLPFFRPCHAVSAGTRQARTRKTHSCNVHDMLQVLYDSGGRAEI
jgi:hypothetical protein